jgi:hypothetical protein
MCAEIPQTPKERTVLIKELFKEQEVHDNIDLYMLLKAMLKSVYTKENEYRRHVAMRAIIAGREEIININIISQYYEYLTSFFHLADNLNRGTYILGSGKLMQDGALETVDEENPNNPYWGQVEQMKKEAAEEIARDKEIKERIRQEKQQREAQYRKRTEELKPKRITKRKPKIKPKKVIPKERLKYAAIKKAAKKAKPAKKTGRKRKK